MEAGIGGGTTCHVLPCGMDKDLTAPIGIYFHPTPIYSVLGRGAGSKHSRTLDLVKILGDEKDNSTSTTMMSPEEEGDDTKKEVEKEEVGGAEVQVAMVLAAQFRGRGLLCIADSKKTTSTTTSTTTTPLSELPPDMMGAVFSSSLSSAPSSSSFGGGKNTMTNKTVSLRPIETFRSLCSWSHEHDPRKVMGDHLKDGCGHGDDRIGLNAALSWRDLAREIHDPIPI